MLDICEHQLLVLLFVVQAKRKDRRQLGQSSLIQLPQQGNDMFIDIRAILIRLLDSGTRYQAAIGPAVPFPKRVVVRIEQVGILWVKAFVISIRRREEKGLPKPGNMRQMPFRRTYVWHRL